MPVNPNIAYEAQRHVRRRWGVIRFASTVQWAATALVMREAEVGVDVNTGMVKLGDGTHLWPELPALGVPQNPNNGAVIEDDWPNLTVLAEAAYQ